MDKLNLNFNPYNDAAFLVKAKLIVKQMTGAPEFPAPQPTMAELQSGVSAFEAAIQAASYGDKQLINDRDEKRAALEDLLTIEGYYVMNQAGGERSILLLSGYDLAKTPTPQAPVTNPTNLQLVSGPNSGDMLLTYDKVSGSRIYQVYYTQDATLPESAWTMLTTTTTKIMLTGLVPGKPVFVKVVAVGKKGQTASSEVISKYVQ